MKTAFISVGKEVLTGKTVNTNLTFFAIELGKIGIDVSRSFVIDDVKEEYTRILNCIDEELIIFTGGLGPTVDDITRETVLEFFEVATYHNQDVLNNIKAYFDRLHLEMKDTNNKQALFPENGVLLTNDEGTAPGVYFEAKGKKVALLPGPPNENKPMVSQLISILKQKIKKPLFSKGYRLVGTGESHMEFELNGFYEKHPNVNIAPYAGAGEIKYIFTSDNELDIKEAMAEFYAKFNQYIYGSLTDTLEGVVVSLLRERNLVISTAESCTGGMLSGAITSVSGSSEVFNEGVVTYSNEAKMKYLNVPKDVLNAYGAASEECARSMALGLYQGTSSNITIAITGIAGPTGGTKEKPVGLVYFALCFKGSTTVKRRVFNGNREKVRQRAVYMH